MRLGVPKIAELSECAQQLTRIQEIAPVCPESEKLAGFADIDTRAWRDWSALSVINVTTTRPIAEMIDVERLPIGAMRGHHFRQCLVAEHGCR
jgi:hypothetical protein